MAAFNFSKVNYQKYLVGPFAAEMNFVSSKLRQLPPEKLKAVYDGLRAEAGGEAFRAAVQIIVEILMNADTVEVTEYINEALGSRGLFTIYLITDVRNKGPVFAAFLFNHLRTRENGFEIGVIQNINQKSEEFVVIYEPTDLVPA